MNGYGQTSPRLAVSGSVVRRWINPDWAQKDNTLYRAFRKNNYNISLKSERLGSGAFGSVFKTNNVQDPSFIVAIKVLDKKKLHDDLDLIMEEVAILNTIDHPNICHYYETYDDKKYIYLVMEYISGKTIFQKIGKKTYYGEREAAKYMI